VPHQSIRHQNNQERLGNLEEELMDTLLQDEPIYPWNPAEPEADAYFETVESEFSLADWLGSEEVTLRSQAFFGQLDRCWESVKRPTLETQLLARFGRCAPREWLATIAQQAATLLPAQLSPADRLVQCVEPLLSQWARDDLYIFARPLVYAMRDGSTQEVEGVNWDELSSVEQARYSMKIACYALETLKTGEE